VVRCSAGLCALYAGVLCCAVRRWLCACASLCYERQGSQYDSVGAFACEVHRQGLGLCSRVWVTSTSHPPRSARGMRCGTLLLL
jgi:hypothetical protein